MALANVAELFYQAGLNVLMVDWDLEAPGLDRFFFPPDRVEEILDKFGVMDMMLGYKRRMAQPPSSEKGEEETLPFEDPEQFLVDVSPNGAGNGRLWLLPAGRRLREHFAEYVSAVLTFDWEDFYQNWEGGLYIEWLRRRFEEIADVVLIDSRTGVTEIGGVCTYQLADVIAMLCAANQQSLEGIYNMARSFKRREAEEFRSNRPLEVIVVPARLEQAEGDKLNQFKQDFLSLSDAFVPSAFKRYPEVLWSLGIPYVPYYAYNEIVAVREREKAIAEPLVKSFEKLARTLVQLAPDGSPLKRAFSAEPMQALEGQDALVAFRSDFQIALKQIDVLYDYKRLHDLFQELGELYSLIDQDLKRLPSDQIAWESLELYSFELQDTINGLLDVARQAPLAVDETWWTQQLSQARAEMRMATENYDLAQLRSVTRRLNLVLAREFSRINTRLVAAADAMRLGNLVKTMTNIRNSLDFPGVDRQVMRQFEESIEALARLNHNLAELVANHDSWQAIDDELRRIEATLDQDIVELELTWPDLKKMTHNLCGDSTADWAISLNRASDELESALLSENPVNTRRLFWRFHGQSSRRFRQVDSALLSLCQDLQKIVEPLDLLLRMVQ